MNLFELFLKAKGPVRRLTKLDEAVETIQTDDGQTVHIQRDPPPMVVSKMLKQCERLRGIDHDGTIWLWDGYAAVHFQVESHLGLPRPECAEFMLQFHEGADDVPLLWLFNHVGRMRHSDKLKRLMSACPMWRFAS